MAEEVYREEGGDDEGGSIVLVLWVLWSFPLIYVPYDHALLMTPSYIVKGKGACSRYERGTTNN